MSCTVASVTRARSVCDTDIRDSNTRHVTEVRTLQLTGHVYTCCLLSGISRKQKRERQSREKADMVSWNLLARHTLLNTAALRDICHDTTGAGTP